MERCAPARIELSPPISLLSSPRYRMSCPPRAAQWLGIPLGFTPQRATPIGGAEKDNNCVSSARNRQNCDKIVTITRFAGTQMEHKLLAASVHVNIVESTRFYEAWLADQTDLQRKRLGPKHEQMAVGPFPFLCATFYRWIQRWRKECRQLDQREEDVVLALGDLHLENFGTWRDARGRMVWGVVDYDEACRMPFTMDLVRLATSIALAADLVESELTLDAIADCLVAGYQENLSAGGVPIFVGEMSRAQLTAWTNAASEPPEDFWTRKLKPEENPLIKPKELPRGLEDVFRSALPRDAKPTYLRQRRPEGLGSLGRRRYIAVLRRDGGQHVAWEARALVPSAVHWLEMQAAATSLSATLLQRVVRSPDPTLQVHDRWLVRQLAPDASKLELSALRKGSFPALSTDLFRAMGFESANIHLGSKSPRELQTALSRLDQELGTDWLRTAAERMAQVTREDQLAWQKHWTRHSRSARHGKSAARTASS